MTGFRPNRSAIEPPKKEMDRPHKELMVINVAVVVRFVPSFPLT